MGATKVICILNPDWIISIHAPAWGATLLRQSKTRMITDFNPRSRVGSDVLCRYRPRTSRNFNPRSRVGSDACGISICCTSRPISIHAPAWGATDNFELNTIYQIFQSTLPRGERLQKYTRYLLQKYCIFKNRSFKGRITPLKFEVFNNFTTIQGALPAFFGANLPAKA